MFVVDFDSFTTRGVLGVEFFVFLVDARGGGGFHWCDGIGGM